MRRIRLQLVLYILAAVIIALFLFIFNAGRTDLPRVVMKTEAGEIEIEVNTNKAPVTSTNFLKYVDNKRFTGAIFYRVVTLENQPNDSIKIQVIQGGLGFEESDQRLPPIFHETTKETGILHKDGTISMARLQPGTASSEFFICIEDQPELDFGGKRNPDGQGFAAFGRVVSGMDVVRSIQQESDNGQMLINPVKILEVSRVEH